jgi:cell division protein FtsQ
LGAKKVRQNKYKRKQTRKKQSLPVTVFKSVIGLLALGALSLFYIFCYDLVTQIDYLRTSEIVVSGNQRLSEDLVKKQAGIAQGMNILGFNLAKARKSLLAHPWIAEADVRRVIPAGIRIRIKEHRAAAVIDLGPKYLMDEAGVIFKKFDPSDPRDLPVIKGLQYADLQIGSGPDPSAANPPDPIFAVGNQSVDPAMPTVSLYDAVVGVLALGQIKGSVLPIGQINQIYVDREIGLTLQTFNRTKTILLGFNHYVNKYAMLKSIMDQMKNGAAWHFEDIKWIDLKNLNRIVINPFRSKEKS